MNPNASIALLTSTIPVQPLRDRTTLLTEDDLYLFNEGSHFRLYDKLGAHPLRVDGMAGTYFAVWAPNAEQVCVTGDFNGWDKSRHPMRPRGQSGIWECFVGGVGEGALYKYHVVSRDLRFQVDKADPCGFSHEVPPRTASMVWPLNYEWGDRRWMEDRHQRNALDAPFAIYEVHLGSWMRMPEQGHRPLTYRDLAPRLARYVRRMGFTHVESCPSWNTHSTAPEDTKSPDFSRRQAGTGPLKISCTWLTICTSTASG